MTTGYVIACDKRDAPEVTLFMVDRRKVENRFWSQSLESAFVYHLLGAAQRKAASLKYNNPRVLSWEQAQILAKANAGDIPEELFT